jgi:hypothetical protein
MTTAIVFDGVSRLARGEVVGLNENGTVTVCGEDGVERTCELLWRGPGSDEIERGDRVLCWLEGSGLDAGVVLGILGASVFSPSTGSIPEEIVVEATQGLILKCGESSITMRPDGKILIKGKDLVSHAQRTNRIKGGSVAIN